MMVPQPTAQYGQVERVSLARAIFRVRNCAYAGFKSKPNTAAAAPPIVVNFRKSRRGGGILAPPSPERKGGPGCDENPPQTSHPPGPGGIFSFGRPSPATPACRKTCQARPTVKTH